MTDISDWEKIKGFYKESFGIDGWVVELMANMDILLLCASGSSNSTITKFLEIPIEDVVLAINDTFGFTGWEVDLSANPYKTFIESLDKDKEVTKKMFGENLHVSDSEILDIMYDVCKTMYDIETKLESEWI